MAMTDAVSAFLLPNLVFTAGILAVLVLRKPVRAQFGAKMAYALWLLPLLVLAASFLPPRVVDVQSAPVFAVLPSGPEYVLPAAPTEALPAAPIFTSAPKPAFDPLLAALALWITGALAMFAWLGRRQALFMTDVRKGIAGPAVVGVFRPRIITPSDFDIPIDPSATARTPLLLPRRRGCPFQVFVPLLLPRRMQWPSSTPTHPA
jgi:beta-lactamase regulating signal transducer with metallopeptidase domain